MANPSAKLIAGSNPAANAEIAEVVGAGKILELLAVRVVLVQGLTQTPQPILQITDPNDVVVFESLGSSAAQAASTTAAYNWAVGLQLSGQIGATPNIRSFAPLPRGLLLAAGWKIKTSTLGIGAGTDYAAPTLLVVERG